jgi:hypothetical protein
LASVVFDGHLNMWLSLNFRQSRAATRAQFVGFIHAYLELLIAYWECVDGCRRPSENPVSLARFHHYHVDENILLWMIFRDHVEHLKSPPESNGQHACLPMPANSLILTSQSCFALKDKGAAFADAFLADVLLPQVEGAFQAAWNGLMVGALLPSYQPTDRTFAWGEHLLKRFRQPAANQELILISAEEQQWPDWFDDPLPRKIGQNPKIILHDTIKDLNRRQNESLVHFKGDGSGRRVGWELI